MGPPPPIFLSAVQHVVDLFQKGLFRHLFRNPGPFDCPLLKKNGLVRSECDAQIGMSRLARPVHLAPHNRNVEIGVYIGNLSFKFLDDLAETSPAAAAGGTGDDVDAAFS